MHTDRQAPSGRGTRDVCFAILALALSAGLRMGLRACFRRIGLLALLPDGRLHGAADDQVVLFLFEPRTDKGIRRRGSRPLHGHDDQRRTRTQCGSTHDSRK